LQALFASTYERGRYWRSLKYLRPPKAPLADVDRQWASSLAANV
jgi:hypothetical protein